MNIPEPARAWAWHTTRAALILAAATAVVAAGSALIITTAYALAGHGSWLIPTAYVATAVVTAGTVTWWRAGKTRP